MKKETLEMDLHRQANNAHTQTHIHTSTLFPHHHRSFSFKHRSRQPRERAVTAKQKHIVKWIGGTTNATEIVLRAVRVGKFAV